MMMRCLAILLLVLAALAGVAQPALPQVPVQPAAGPGQLTPDLDTSRPEDADIIPFNRVGNLIILQATADTTKGNFILDTGAPGLVLNLTYFRNYPQTDASDRGSVFGTIKGAVQTMVNQFRFGKFQFRKLDADMISLGHLEDRRGIKILGLIGVSFFKDCELVIDYEKNLLYLYRIPRKNAVSRRSNIPDSARASRLGFEIIDNKVIVLLKLGERKMRFFIDTGAESNLLDSRLPNKVFEQMTITGRTRLVGSGNKTVEALYGKLNNIKVSTNELASLPFVITNLENACISEVCCIDGILGFDFLSLYKFGFDFLKKEMYLWK